MTNSPPPTLPKFNPWSQLNPIWWFKNADDPVPPESYRPNDKSRKLKWSLRNPLHNFTFYVIGIADKEFVRSGRFPNRTTKPGGGWDFAVSKYHCLRLPYVSYQRGRFTFYLGWRPRGNFGVKFNFHTPGAGYPAGASPQKAAANERRYRVMKSPKDSAE